MRTTPSPLRKLLAEATPGPWTLGAYWLKARTHPPAAPKRPTCAYCAEFGAPLKVERDQSHPVAEFHWHRAAEPWTGKDHEIEGAFGAMVAGNYDYEEGGIFNAADARLIVYLRNEVAEALAEWEEAIPGSAKDRAERALLAALRREPEEPK